MCGISGYIAKKNYLKENALDNTLGLMKRRGPDFQGNFKKDFISKELGLLHSRLSVIDLSSRSNQPYKYSNYILIFNGEIYNFEEIRHDLKKKNYKFQTKSDTEVLIKSFEEYGHNCVDHFVGMWAFAIWDFKKKKLFLSRDPFGEKPLYYFADNHGFFFGSEIKFIKSLCKKKFKINNDLINKNLFGGYKSLNKKSDTFYKNIFSLNSGTNMLIDLDFNLFIKKYWTPRLRIKKKMTKHEAIEGVKHKLIKSLKLRMRSDVPLAFCLSGGVDSGLLVSHAVKKLNKKVSTFSIIDNDERYDESDNIKSVINHTKCKNYSIKLEKNKNSFFERLQNLTNYHDGPVATLSYYIHSFLSEQISKKKFKVAISGTGADEIFTGYYDHYLLHLEATQNSKHFKKNLNDWKNYILPNIRNPFLKNPFFYIKNKNNRDLVYEKNFRLNKYSLKQRNIKFSEIKYCSELLRNRMLNELFNEVVPVILKHDDLNSMYYSIENRSPYLDRELLDFSLKIPPHLLISNGYQKFILRESAKNTLVESVRTDRHKKGFNASINSVVDLMDPEVRQIIFDKKSLVNEFVDLKKLEKDLNLKNLDNHFSKLIFSIIGTKFFLESQTK